jgi:signal transduction histidine kinase
VLAIVAHDLRNPLNTIAMASGALLELPLSDSDRRRQLEAIRRSATNMNLLIADLLDVTRIELGSLSVRYGHVQVDALFDETVELFEQLAQPRGIRIEREVAPDLPPVVGDRGRLAQVLSNLVGNALKFSPVQGRVTLRATPATAAVKITVEDRGSGIAPENLPHVFDRFWQADRTARTGAGLGLAIAKGIVEAHGGAIWAESTPGEATRFHFTLPVARENELAR